MRQRVVLGAVIGLVLAALVPGTSGAGPAPEFTVTCGNTGFTEVTWQHAKLSQVTLDWVGTNGPIEKVVPVLAANRPKGYISDSPGSPGFTPASVTVTTTNVEGSANDPTTVNCV